MHRVAAPFTALSRGSLLLLNQHSSRGGLAESHPISSPSLLGGEGSSFPGLIPSDDTVNSESAVGIKPGDSGVLIGYQVDEFTCTWSSEQFVVHSHIYSGFTSKVLSLTHFPLEPGCQDYSFLDQAVADFEQGLDSILTDSVETLELDTSLDEPDAVTSSVSSSFSTWIVLFLIILNCNSLLALGLINSGARLRPFLHLCLWLPRCEHLNWFIIFLATLQPLDSSPLHHQISSLWFLPTGSLIRVCQNFRLALVLLHMLLSTHSSSFLTI